MPFNPTRQAVNVSALLEVAALFHAIVALSSADVIVSVVPLLTGRRGVAAWLTEAQMGHPDVPTLWRIFPEVPGSKTFQNDDPLHKISPGRLPKLWSRKLVGETLANNVPVVLFQSAKY